MPIRSVPDCTIPQRPGHLKTGTTIDLNDDYAIEDVHAWGFFRSRRYGVSFVCTLPRILAWPYLAVRIYMDIPLNSYEEILIDLKGPIHVFPNGF
jgi:hypothetical protein